VTRAAQCVHHLADEEEGADRGEQERQAGDAAGSGNMVALIANIGMIKEMRRSGEETG
jgi:hypothetical protein